MRKSLAAILIFLILMVPCICAFAEAASMQQPEMTDLTSLLSMTRADVEALYGAGEVLPFSDISDYHESAFELGGFPYLYSTVNGIMVFYDAVPQADGTVPYGCLESPEDRVLGIMLQPETLSFHVAGFKAVLNAESITALDKEFKAKTEHVNGLYEYYRIRAEIGGILYVWISDAADMTCSALYASLI